MQQKTATKFQSYKEFRDQFEKELVYTRQDMATALAELEKRCIVNRVIMEGKDTNVALRIQTVQRTDEGLIVIVR